MRKLLLFPAVLVLAGIIVACEDEKHTYVANVSDPETTPTMVTEDVTTLISDSGYTRYKIVSPVWNIYDDAKEPHWTFPEGLALENYDLAMKVAANMNCDSATYFSNKRIWRLDGNVVMVNNGVKDEAVSALTMLGFSPAPSAKVVVDILKAQPDLQVEQVVKLALKQIK